MMNTASGVKNFESVAPWSVMEGGERESILGRKRDKKRMPGELGDDPVVKGPVYTVALPIIIAVCVDIDVSLRCM